MSCNFDEDTFCSWHNEQMLDKFDWTLHRMSTASMDTGPDADHTVGTANGIHQYIVFEGIVGDGYVGDIALDDISFADGACGLSSTTAPVITTAATTWLSTTSSGPINGCEGNPCIHGMCYVHQKEYFCLCHAGYGGQNCQIDQDECNSSPCKNGATCEDDVDNFVCHCKHGYAGILCETVLDPCFYNPCVNGKCFSHLSLFLCICPAHYTGKYCEISQDICASMPCLNGATCSSRVDTLTCSCSEGFDGTRCEH
ncbi:NOTC2-like protein, partial [Mya arenaria]